MFSVLWLMTACTLAELSAPVPVGWESEAMLELPDGHVGCLFLRSSGEGELLGMVRVRAARVSEVPPQPMDRNELVAWEVATIEAMGLAISGEPLWIRDDVPVQVVGEAAETLEGSFSLGQAVGLAAEEVDAGTPWEVHLLVFHGEDHWYSLALLTPLADESMEDHRRNLDAFGTVLQTLQPG